MIKNDEPLIEYNIRMGDPECQVLMMKLKTDRLSIIEATINNNLSELNIEWDNKNVLQLFYALKDIPGNMLMIKKLKIYQKLI